MEIMVPLSSPCASRWWDELRSKTRLIRSTRKSRRLKVLVAIAVIATTPATAQMPPPPPELPPEGPLDMIAGIVIQKYKTSSCEDLKAKKGEPPPEVIGAAVAFLKGNPSLKVKFINKVAAPVANKMFDCGMIP